MHENEVFEAKPLKTENGITSTIERFYTDGNS